MFQIVVTQWGIESFLLLVETFFSIMSMLDHASNAIVADFNMITALQNVFE